MKEIRIARLTVSESVHKILLMWGYVIEEWDIEPWVERLRGLMSDRVEDEWLSEPELRGYWCVSCGAESGGA